MKSFNKSIDLPSSLRHVLQTVIAAGYQAYVVGGGVRDALLGRPVQDWDIATSATPEQIQGLFDKTIPTGMQHGTVTVRNNGSFFEITTFRTDGLYIDGRRPETVQFVDNLEADLGRRDFTINALAFAPLEYRQQLPRAGLIDPWQGREDLHRKVIRTVRDADSRFTEDGLRLLRAARFAAQLNFVIEPATFASMRRHAALLGKISAERIRDEFNKTLLSAQPVYGISLLIKAGLLVEILPELGKRPAVLSRAIHRLRRLQRKQKTWDIVTILTLLLLDLGVETSRGILRRLRYANDEIDATVQLLQLVRPETLNDLQVIPLRKMLSTLAPAQMQRLMLVMTLWAGPLRKKVLKWRRALESVQRQGQSFRLTELALDGDDLMVLCGLPPGPEVGRRLRFLQEAVWLQPELNNRQILQQLAVEVWRNEWM